MSADRGTGGRRAGSAPLAGNRTKILFYAVAVIAIVIFAAPRLREGPRTSPRLLAVRELWSIRVAVDEYRLNTGTFPTGSVADICRTLSSVGILKIPRERVSETGAFLDGWGTPYDIRFLSRTNVVTRSAGEDRQLDTKDDVDVR